jgi:DNA-binding transcriptional MerR regulator
MFKIGDFSKLTRVSVRMLRYYDEMGLLPPAKVDDFTNYRYYSAKQIEKLSLIVHLRDMGFNVAEIAQVISQDSKKAQTDMLVKKRREIKQSIKKQNEMLAKIDSVINNFKKEKQNMSYNVGTKSVPSYKVISYRQVIPAYNAEGELWEKLGTYMGKNNIESSGFCYATYHDGEYKEKKVDVEVVMEVKELSGDRDGFLYKKTEPIDLAVYVLVPGDYQNISPAYAYLANWIEENGYTVTGLVRQIPIKGPWNEQNPDDYLNEIQIPVAK